MKKFWKWTTWWLHNLSNLVIIMSLYYALDGWNGKFCFAYSIPINNFSTWYECCIPSHALFHLIFYNSNDHFLHFTDELRSWEAVQPAKVLSLYPQHSKTQTSVFWGQLQCCPITPELPHRYYVERWSKERGLQEGERERGKKMEGDLNSMTTAIIRSLKLYKNKICLYM